MQGVVAALRAVAVVMHLQGAGVVAEGAAEAVTGVDGAAARRAATTLDLDRVIAWQHKRKGDNDAQLFPQPPPSVPVTL